MMKFWIMLGKQAELFAIWAQWREHIRADFYQPPRAQLKYDRGGKHLPHRLKLCLTKTNTMLDEKFIVLVKARTFSILKHLMCKIDKSIFTCASRVWRIGIWAVVTSSTGANSGCSRAGAAVGWAWYAETVTLFRLEGARVASCERKETVWTLEVYITFTLHYLKRFKAE